MIFYRLTDIFNFEFLQIFRANRFLILIFLVWLSAPINVVPAQYRIDQWTADTGLPQNTVNDILQTRDGYLWLATVDGLVRFDGVRFTVFNKSNSSGISNNRFQILHEDAQGDLWATTEDGGVIRNHQGKFISFGKEQGFKTLRAVNFPIDNEGNLFVRLVNNQLFQWIDERFVEVDELNLPLNDKPIKRLTNRRVQCLLEEQTRVHCLVYGAKNSWTKADGLPSLKLAEENGVESRDGILWVALAEDGLVKIENGKIAKIYTERDGLPGNPILLISGANISLLSKDKENNYWLTNIEKWENRSLGKQLPIPFEPGNTIGYEDREGNFWFGTNRDGLYRARQQSITTYSKTQGLEQNNVYPIYEDKNGVIWIGTTEGLFYFKDGTISREKKIPVQLITSISEDHSGRLMVMGFDQVWVWDGTKFNLLFRKVPDSMWAIYQDQENTFWFGWEQGLIQLKNGVETIFTTKDGLAGDAVKTIIDDKAGGFWIGTYGGLSHYKDGKFTSWTENDGLPSRTIRSLYLDRDGILWIGTYDGGLGRFKDGKFTAYTIKDGLFNNGVFQILEDKRGNFWMSSNRGIYRVSRQELNEFAEGRRNSITSIAYGKSDGMLNVECNGGRQPAGIIARDGKMWFPTQDGVAVVAPDAIQINPKPPPVKIESFLIDRNPVTLEDEIQIQSNQENFEINYTALSFINSENLRFKYKLESLDQDWFEAGTRRTAYFSYIPPGSYVFKVIGANSDGVWNLEGASIKITVLPHFYQTWWFRLFGILGVLGIGFLIYRIRINQLTQARQKQEEFSRKLLASQEQERQRIAAELHDSLGQSLLIIKNRIALAQSDIDEKETVEEQLEELSHSATSAIEECREIAYNLRPYQISRFGLSKTLYGIFMRINEVTKIRATADIEPIDDLLSDEAQINLYRVVQECVNNIIKHSQATEASLFIKQTPDDITLLIQDNGRGFVPNANQTGENKRGGFGLIGMAERVKMLNGSYEIDSTPNEGTSIRIRIKQGQVIK